VELTLQSRSPEETFQWGQKLAAILAGGDVVCLYGSLGAGKTAFAQGVGAGLAIREPITSPTFTIIHEYLLPTPKRDAARLIHMDLYRLNSTEEAEQAGAADILQEDTITLIEWPQIALPLLTDDRLELAIEGNGEQPRRLIFKATAGDWLCRWRQGEGQ
jgi:tRNA threonylcarbamoyladenosine biosynthesis protein TsaE